MKRAADGAYRQVFREGEAVLLTAQASWPRLEEDGPGLRRINRYYDALADRWIKRWEGSLLAQAKAAAGPETPPWSAELSFTVTCLREDLFSLYLDAEEDVDGKRPRRVRMGDVWRLPSGTPVTLREFFPDRRFWRGAVLEQVRQQIGAQVAAGEALFFEAWPRLTARRFSPDRFYLTEKGPVLFYPVESIAPALEGFPTFLLRPEEEA